MGAKTTFKKSGGGAATAKKKSPAKKQSKPAAAEEVEVVESGETAIVEQDHNPPAMSEDSSEVVGEILPEDIKRPRLNLVQAMSELHTEDEFAVGSLILAKEVELMDKEGEMEFVAIQIMKRYQQKLPFGTGDPLIFDKVAEVKANEGTIQWSKEAVDDLRYFESRADIVLGIKAPEELPQECLHLFPFEIGEDHWARVDFTVKGSGYKACAKDILTQQQGNFKGKLELARFVMSAELKNYNGNSWYVTPVSFKGEETDPAHIDLFREMAGKGTEEPEGE